MLAAAWPVVLMFGCGKEETATASVVINEILPDNEKYVWDCSHDYLDENGEPPRDQRGEEIEFSRSPEGCEPNSEYDDFAEYDDCIELYNRGSRSIDISDYTLETQDSAPASFRSALDLGPGETLTLDGGEVLLLWADNGGVGEGVHLPFRLDADLPNSLTLRNGDTAQIDHIRFLTPGTPRSYARIPDGEDAWQWCASPTPGRLNGDECPTRLERTDAGTSSGTGGRDAGSGTGGRDAGSGNGGSAGSGNGGSSAGGAGGSAGGGAGGSAGSAGSAGSG